MAPNNLRPRNAISITHFEEHTYIYISTNHKSLRKSPYTFCRTSPLRTSVQCWLTVKRSILSLLSSSSHTYVEQEQVIISDILSQMLMMQRCGCEMTARVDTFFVLCITDGDLIRATPGARHQNCVEVFRSYIV